MSNPIEVTGANGALSLTRDVDHQSLNDELRTAAGFAEFKQDPQAFAARHGVTIDNALAARLGEIVRNASRIGDIVIGPDTDNPQATVAAVVVGVFVPVSAKIAVAF